MNALVAVAAGSALGGVLRYLGGLAAVRVWGDAFPWGTLAINVLGSFVIGAFGALTAPGGAAPAGVTLRLFVIVGLCGGFTTFSSFSLQTFELARGGNLTSAVGNAGLSVLLCLAAVTLGVTVAERAGIVRRAAGLPPVVLAILDHPETARAVLQTAGAAAERLGASRLDAVHLREGALAGFLPTEEVEPAADPERDAKAAELSEALARCFAEWRATSGFGTYREVTSQGPRALAVAAASASLVVMARQTQPERVKRHGPSRAFHTVLFQARAPLLVPAQEVSNAQIGTTVAIAWQPNDRHAARALAAAAPFLRDPTQRLVLGNDLPPGLPPNTAREPLERNPGEDVGRALAQQAEAAGADLLVLGAFGGTAAGEYLFGSTTREVLTHARMALLMRH